MASVLHLTDEEHTEWGYRYQERLGILCDYREPTPEQVALASKEADEAILALRALDPCPTALPKKSNESDILLL